MNQPVEFSIEFLFFTPQLYNPKKKTRFVSLQGEGKTLSSWNMFWSSHALIFNIFNKQHESPKPWWGGCSMGRGCITGEP